MTDERTREQDPRFDPPRPAERRDDERRPGPKDEKKSPWTREGADAPDAADIEAPEEQR